jgi:group I intron endonuclease
MTYLFFKLKYTVALNPTIKATFNSFMGLSLLSTILLFLFTLFFIDYNTQILGELFQVTRINQSFEILLSFVPIIYPNVASNKSRILSENKGKAAIYQWKHKESGKIYIGSAFDLTKRFSLYYSKNYLEKNKSYINRAILLHGYSLFSLTILEYVGISDLSKEEARNLILEREQDYINILKPEYNINPTAGSSLGALHTEQAKALISEALKGENHPMYGKTHSPDTLAKFSGENNHFFGKTHTVEAKVKMSEAKTGSNHPLFGIRSEDHPMYGKKHSAEALIRMSEARKGMIVTEEHKAKISKSMSKKVFVYSSSTPTILQHEFGSYTEAAKHFNCNIMTISKYIKSEKLYLNQWILISSKK